MSPLQLELSQRGEKRSGICLDSKAPLMLTGCPSSFLGLGDDKNARIDGLALGNREKIKANVVVITCLNTNFSPEGKGEAIMHFWMCKAKNTHVAFIVHGISTQQWTRGVWEMKTFSYRQKCGISEE